MVIIIMNVLIWLLDFFGIFKTVNVKNDIDKYAAAYVIFLVSVIFLGSLIVLSFVKHFFN